MEAVIPDKLYFKIGEVADIASLRPSVLRYWESEFGMLRPGKSRAGQRMYSRKDLDMVLTIKQLLYVEKLTIEGARKRIATGSCKSGPGLPVYSERNEEMIREVCEELRKLSNSLNNDTGA
jgi:DNA-binding transcriptional MerR regulator